jgi:hypothetical protein
MSTRLALVAIFGAGMLAVACRSEPRPDAIPEGIPGTYTYVVNGSWAGKVLWEAEATLDLKPDGTFELSLEKKSNSGKDSNDRTHGTYTVSGDRIWITQSRAAGGFRARESHSLVIRPDSLVGKISWKDHLVLRGLGISDPVFVKRQT